MNKTGIKTRDLRPCDNCGGNINPFCYRLKIEIRQLLIDQTATNEVLGTTAILGGNLILGEAMSPNRDAVIEMPGYRIDKDLFLCADCVMGSHESPEPFTISPLDLMVEHEEQSKTVEDEE